VLAHPAAAEGEVVIRDFDGLGGLGVLLGFHFACVF
jgi:hypothetical protein